MNIILLLIFLFGCFIFSYLERSYNIPHSHWIFIVPFSVLMATRSLDVPDTEVYMNYFLMEEADLINFYDYGFEWGFQLLTKLVKFISEESYHLFFWIVAIINLSIMYTATKQIISVYNDETTDEDNDTLLNIEKDKFYAFIFLTLYIAFYGLYLNAIVIRVGIAFSLIVLASSFALKPKLQFKDYILIALFIALAVLFHSTALLGIIIILIILLSKRYSMKFYLIFLIVTGLFYFFNITTRLGGTVINVISSLNTLTLLSNRLERYDVQSLMMSEGISMKFVFFWIMSFFLLFSGENKKVFYKIFNVYIFGIVLFALMRSVLLVERVTDYFLLFSFVLFFFFVVKKESWRFWLYYVGIVLVQLIFVMRIINRDII